MAFLYEENHSSEIVKSAGRQWVIQIKFKKIKVYISAMTRVRELYTVKNE